MNLQPKILQQTEKKTTQRLEKAAQQFLAETRENSLESSRPKPAPKLSPRKKPPNSLDRANALCAIANQDAAAMIDQQAQDPRRFAVFFQEFCEQHPGVGVRFTGKDVEEAFRRLQENAKLEHLWLKQQLNFVIDNGKWLVPGYVASRDPAGRTVLMPANLFQALVSDVLNDPKIDIGRFGRCDICQNFFYRPRGDTRTCTRRCGNTLTAREHYAREKENRARALDLHSQGKNPFQIHHEMGISLTKVRAYLTR